MLSPGPAQSATADGKWRHRYKAQSRPPTTVAETQLTPLPPLPVEACLPTTQCPWDDLQKSLVGTAGRSLSHHHQGDGGDIWGSLLAPAGPQQDSQQLFDKEGHVATGSLSFISCHRQRNAPPILSTA